ncbi:uncharacterized protein LOC128872733 [Hylaeus volcanicus]|uniref:uncharacterized protein LOC128872733 n=1 Tax=Hylaeus volcanicus TaxID=313075 RepID=UPI0023B79A58|nr:uncharacterized protein LOC128872733 [Hylaeus volcanicus]
MFRKEHTGDYSDVENQRKDLERRLEKLEKENRKLRRKKKRKSHRRRNRSSDAVTDKSWSSGYRDRFRYSRARSFGSDRSVSSIPPDRSEQEDNPADDRHAGQIHRVLLDSTSQLTNLRNNPVDDVPLVDSGEPVVLNTEAALRSDILDIFGKRICEERVFGPPVLKDLVVRCEDVIKEGLSEEIKVEVLKKYPPPSNCTSIDHPKLNPEFKSVVQELVAKSNDRIRKKQEKITASLALAMQAMSIVVKGKENPEMLSLVKYLFGLIQLLADLQHDESFARRSLILANINASLRDAVNASGCGEFLFGSNLEEVLKNAKTLESSCRELKVAQRSQPLKQTKNLKFPPRQPQTRNYPAASGGQKPRYHLLQKKQPQFVQKPRYQRRDRDRN